MTETVSERLPDYPFTPGPMSTLSEQYTQRQATCPFGRVQLPSGHDATLLVTHRDVAAALGDSRLSNNLTAPGSPRGTISVSFLDNADIIVNMDGEKHRRIRRIVAPAFTPRRVEQWKPAIRTIADQLLDDMEEAGPPTDIVAEFCLQLPARVICALLGVPEDDAHLFRDGSNALSLSVQMSEQERLDRAQQFVAYIVELLGARRITPGADLVDDLIAACDGADRLTEPELVSLIIALIGAGNETTSNVLGRSLVTLLHDERALWNQLLDDQRLIPAAVDELVRFNPFTTNGLLRVATQDVELPSGTIQAGQAVVLAWYAAMRDASVYQDPDTVRFDRGDFEQLAFGKGPHFCLGAYVAKAELAIALERLLNRLPGLRLATGLDELRFTEGELMSSLVSLPVTW